MGQHRYLGRIAGEFASERASMELVVWGWSDTHVSARTIRVLLAFSMENLTFPPSPAIRPEC